MHAANTMNTAMLSLDLAELVLTVAIRANVTVRSINADALAILNVLGPRQEFPTITDAALHHMLWINLDSLAQAGDTQLLGRLLDPTLPKPNPPIRTLRSSPFALARASEAGHLDFLGYWLRLAHLDDDDANLVPLTVPMVRRAISAAVRAERPHVVDWWFNALPNLFSYTYQADQCWEMAFQAARSKRMLDHMHRLWTESTGLVLHDYTLVSRALRRAHADKHAAAVDWWLAHVPQLQVLRFMLPRIMRWKRPHFKHILYLFRASTLGVPTLTHNAKWCQRLCWWPAVPLLFADLEAWRTHELKVFEEMVAKTDCNKCVGIIFESSSPACPIPECVHDHCVVCAMPDNRPDKLAEYNTGTHSLIDSMCKHGHAEGFRAWLRSDAKVKILAHALHVASKHGHVEILKAWLEEYAGKNEHGKYRVWDGVGIDILEWLLEHDVDRKLLQWMSVDEASRAGQTHVLDWWLDRFRKGQVPTLRFSYKALQFKSYESGMKSLRWWFRSGLLLDHGRIVVSVWRYCYLEQLELVEMLIAADVSVCFERILRPLSSASSQKSDEMVIEGIKEWWEKAKMGVKTGRESFTECLHSHPPGNVATNRHSWMELVCKWSRLLEHDSAKES